MQFQPSEMKYDCGERDDGSLVYRDILAHVLAQVNARLALPEETDTSHPALC